MISDSTEQSKNISQSGSFGIGVNQGNIDVENLAEIDQRGQIVDTQLNFTDCIIQIPSEEFLGNTRSRHSALMDKQHFRNRLEMMLEMLTASSHLSPKSLNTLESELDIWTKETGCPINQEIMARIYLSLAEEYTTHAYEGNQSKWKAIKTLNKGEVLCKEAKAEWVLCKIWNQRGIAFHNLKDRDSAVQNFQQMRQLSNALGDMQSLSKALIDQSFTESYAGNPSLGERLAHEAENIGLSKNDQDLIFNAKLSRISAQMIQQKKDDALGQLSDSLTLYRIHDEINPMWYVIHQIFHGIVLLQTEDFIESEKHFQSASIVSYKQKFLGMVELLTNLRLCENNANNAMKELMY